MLCKKGHGGGRNVLQSKWGWRGGQLSWGGGPSSVPPASPRRGESALPNEMKLLPPPAQTPTQINKTKPKSGHKEHLRLPRYFISQKELNSEAHTHRTAREGGDRRWPKAGFFLPALPPCLRLVAERGTWWPSRDPVAEQGPGGSEFNLIPQQGTGWLLSSREEAAGSRSVLRAWPSVKRRIRGPAGQCEVSPATRDTGLSSVPPSLVGQPMAWQLAHHPQGGQQQHLGRVGS